MGGAATFYWTQGWDRMTTLEGATLPEKQSREKQLQAKSTMGVKPKGYWFKMAAKQERGFCPRQKNRPLVSIQQ